MIKRARYAIAYWLLPAAQSRDFFCKTIQRLAAKYNAPPFEPHLTLLVGPDVPGEPERTLARVTNGPVVLPVVGVAVTSKYTKTLFVRFDSTEALLRLRHSLGEEGEAFDPHLSLLYKRLPKAEQVQLPAEIKTPFTSVIFDAIAATRCRLPVASAADVAIWKSIGWRALRLSA